MKKVFLLLFGAMLSLNSNGQSVDEILNNYFENTGGLDKWKKMETMKMVGSAPTPQGDFNFTVFNKRPDKMKIVVDVQGKTLIPQAFDGEVAWGLNPFAGGTNAQKIPEDMVWTIEDQAQFEAAYIDYKKKGHEITYEGEEMVDGTNCYKLKVVKNKNNDKNEITEYHFFDTENYVPIMVRTSMLVGPQKGMETETYFSDYQETEYGVYVPYYIENRTNGVVGQKMVIETVAINEKMDDDIFAYPEPVEVEPVEMETEQMEEAPVQEATPVEEEDKG